jgi:hypothetical protein
MHAAANFTPTTDWPLRNTVALLSQSNNVAQVYGGMNLSAPFAAAPIFATISSFQDRKTPHLGSLQWIYTV